MGDSLAKTVANLPVDEQRAWLDALSEDQLRELASLPWWFIGRPEQQLPDGEWSTWLLKTGRGWGKTRTGAEALTDLVLSTPTDKSGTPTEWAIFADTFSDVRKVCVEGPSGILRVLKSRNIEFNYNRSQWQIILSTGQVIHMIAADTSDAGRGLNLSGLWADEVFKWSYPYATWMEGITPALRIGKRPRAIVTTTPRRCDLNSLWSNSEDGSVVVTRGSMRDNADNLSEAQLRQMEELYGDTIIGRQELYGEDLDDTPGALWKAQDILVQTPPSEMKRTVIAIDPAVTVSETSDETGIVVCGKDQDGNLWVLDDKSGKFSAFEWAKRVNDLCEEWGADLIVYEDNQGGTSFMEILMNVNSYLPVRPIKAKVGKRLRAEPIAMLYEKHQVFHARNFAKLEDQLLTWDPEESTDSPDRLDAMVHGLAELAGTTIGSRYLQGLADVCGECNMPNAKGTVVCRYCHKPMVVS